MMSLCTGSETCLGVNFGYGWEWMHTRLNLQAIKKAFAISRFSTCPKCSGRLEPDAPPFPTLEGKHAA